MTDTPVTMLNTIDFIAVMGSTQAIQNGTDNCKTPGSIFKGRNHL